MYGEAVVSKCTDVLTDLLPAGVVMIMKLLELCIIVNPSFSVVLLKPLLPNIFELVLVLNIVIDIKYVQL